MLTIDRDGEHLAFSCGWDLLIPYSMEQYDGEEPEVTAIPRISRTVRAFLKKFDTAPFSNEALDWLWSRVQPHEDEWGYRGGKYRWRRCRICRIPEGAALPEPLPEVRLLTPEDDSRNLTTYHIAESIEAGCLCVGAVLDGRVVSVAVTHGSVEGRERGEVAELGVETVPSARGRGYASSCLAYASRLLLSRGLIPEYRFSPSNRASGATAARVGYRRVGDACYLLMRKIPRK